MIGGIQVIVLNGLIVLPYSAIYYEVIHLIYIYIYIYI